MARGPIGVMRQLPMFSDISTALRYGSGGGLTYVDPRDPFAGHAWVFAAATVTATAASQAPFRIFRETESTLASRAREAAFLGVPSTIKHGRDRAALLRHLGGPPLERAVLRGLEPLPAHPLTPLLENPNPLQTGMQFFFTGFIWLRTRGEFHIVFEGPDGSPLAAGARPARMWALSPDLFQPILADGSSGELIGWRMQVPYFLTQRYGTYLDLTTEEVAHVKWPHPSDPLRGLSPVSAALGSVDLDNLASQYNRSLIQNGGEPTGVISHEGVLSAKEEDEYVERFDQRYKGSRNRGRTAIFTGGFKYAVTGLSPQDMEHLETRKWNREEILSIMNVPRSILGLTEYVNYATQIGQDGNFWEHTILPSMRLVEGALDYSLLAGEPDTIVAAFDTRNVEALRAGLSDKVKVAVMLAGIQLRVPPRLAYGVVGVEVPTYAQDDKWLPPPTAAGAAGPARPQGQQTTDGNGQPIGGDAGARPQPQGSPNYVDSTSTSSSSSSTASLLEASRSEVERVARRLAAAHDEVVGDDVYLLGQAYEQMQRDGVRDGVLLKTTWSERLLPFFEAIELGAVREADHSAGIFVHTDWQSMAAAELTGFMDSEQLRAETLETAGRPPDQSFIGNASERAEVSAWRMAASIRSARLRAAGARVCVWARASGICKAHPLLSIADNSKEWHDSSVARCGCVLVPVA